MKKTGMPQPQTFSLALPDGTVQEFPADAKFALVLPDGTEHEFAGSWLNDVMVKQFVVPWLKANAKPMAHALVDQGIDQLIAYLESGETVTPTFKVMAEPAA